MDETTRNRVIVGAMVILLSVVWGLLQRRKVARDLEKKIESHRSKTHIRRKSGRIPVETTPAGFDESVESERDKGESVP
jgi:hypothetical protein